ncbi:MULTISPECIES: plasmid SOS inhibition protein A [Edwardsiella]|uniref:plasmid SOS inhibition protein A n=1 Tax=Edwardsiella TaxID=635 RepID=UPI00235130C3|nr:plasmid SOS inhibition protein A [Edwardsiella piscicida]
MVPLWPERQAALQAIIDVENDTGSRRFNYYPYAAAFFRRLTGRGKVTGKALKSVVGIMWNPRERLATLGDYEMAFDTLIRTRGEYCPTPLCSSTRHWLFPEVEFQRRERDRQRARLSAHKSGIKSRRQWERQREQEAIQYHRVVQLAALDLNFQSPDTFIQWNKRHPDLKEVDWLSMFWRWQPRFPSLAELEWLRYGSESLFTLVLNLAAIVRDTPEVVRAQERLYVPNKLGHSGC